jgi:hypothetical protein
VNHLPGPHTQPNAPQAGQPINPHAQAFLNEIEDALAQAQRPAPAIPTAFKDPTPVPPIGTAPPVPQPGIPPQSKAAVDYAVRVLSTGVATALGSGGLSLILYVSRFADPTVCGIIFGAPIALAVPIAALSSLAKRTKEAVQAAPPVIHQHYNGTVDQRHVESNSRGIWVKTNNQLPR